jgi:hypothetical protein
MNWPRTVGVLCILAGLSAAPVLSTRARIVEAEAAPAGAAPEARIARANGRTGLGVELEVMHLRLELAWFESVPITPGRRVVFSWLRPSGASRLVPDVHEGARSDAVQQVETRRPARFH